MTLQDTLRILIIDDSEDDVKLELLELSRKGKAVIHQRIDTEKQLIDALKFNWDAIICDYNMPHFSATEALHSLKESGVDIPFLVVSGKIGEDTAVEIMREGAHDYIMKDNLKRLNAAVDREVKESAVRREKREAENQLQKSKQAVVDTLKKAVEIRDEFLSIASHELRTPLTTLFLQLQIIDRFARNSVDEIYKEIIPKINTTMKSARELSYLINNLLDVSRMGKSDIL